MSYQVTPRKAFGWLDMWEFIGWHFASKHPATWLYAVNHPPRCF